MEDFQILEKTKNIVKNKNIKIIKLRRHSKASETYIDVKFSYPEQKSLWEGSIPIEYRRTGIFADTPEKIAKLLEDTYAQLNPKNYKKWVEKQEKYWAEFNRKTTQPFFEILKNGEWKCVYCELPKNPNWARRIQDIKEAGYTIATNTKMFCRKCNKNTTHLILLPLPRGSDTGYENLSTLLKKRILDVLNFFDVYENRKRKNILPDHKFPEIRWDEKTIEKNVNDMTREEIKKKFQLLSNRRNQQKRECCRNCYQTGRRGFPYGIKFFYKGGERWPEEIPKNGRLAEQGCEGCGWYDIEKWREELNKFIKRHQN